VIWPLFSGLKKREALSAHLFVLIGPATFSSAQDNALDLRRDLKATLVGEATGERPNGYGEVRTIELPNSGLIVQYCTKYFRTVKDSDPPALEPDVRVFSNLADVLAGRDPVLEAALKPAPMSR
ncbi:MAG TPA: peptidase S41, partial [Blastocatellia bacterium]|nr:peptidase S41 [Blastocatellia bacterium]